MPTNLAIDDRLLEEAQRIGGRKTKRQTVNDALQEFIQRRQRRDLVTMFGAVDYDPAFDYKKERRPDGISFFRWTTTSCRSPKYRP